MSRASHDFPVIDVLRAFAAYSVIMLHVIAHTGWSAFPASGVLAWFRHADASVDLFFVISGFVIFISAERLLRSTGWRSYVAKFTLRRIARIAPLHWLTCVVALITIDASLLGHPGLLSHLLAHLGFIHSLHWEWFSSINGVNWTISIEMQFYVAVLFLAPILIRSPSWLLILTGCAVAMAWRWWAFKTTPAYDTEEMYAYRLFVATAQLPGSMDRFVVGMALAKFLQSESHQWLSRHPLRSGLLTGLVAAILFVLLVYPGVTYTTLESATVFRQLGYSIAFAALVLCACLLSVPAVEKALAIPRYAGTISYGLYLWHLPILGMLVAQGLPPLAVCILTLVLTTLVAAASHRWFERPLLNWARRKEAGFRATPALRTYQPH